MVELITLTNPDELNIEFRRIYEEAFPPEERRDWSQMAELLINPQFSFNGIYFHKKIVGFYTIWNLGEFNFMEHFAILDSKRGKGIGSQVFKQILNLSSTLLILEVEEPFTHSARKRIEFYERLNFAVSDGVYYQPPYSIGNSKIKMLLMSNPEKILPHDFAAIQSKIYNLVYQPPYSDTDSGVWIAGIPVTIWS